MRLLGRDVPVVPADDRTLQADDHSKPASARNGQRYVAKAFGDRPDEARAAMETPTASLPPDELNRVGLRLCERFRPDVPPGAEGWRRGNYGLSGSSQHVRDVRCHLHRCATHGSHDATIRRLPTTHLRGCGPCSGPISGGRARRLS